MTTVDKDLPKVVVLEPAWRTIVRELDRAYRHGMETSGAPDEAVFVPLCALKHRPGHLRAPKIERTGLEDLESLVVAEALIPPRAWVNLSAARIRFLPDRDGWKERQAGFDALLDRALARCGRLDVLARGHSHPFDAGSTWPSSPDRVEHLAPCLEYNRTQGLDAGFTFIAVRGEGGEGWGMQAFATRDGDAILDLGLAEIAHADERWASLITPPSHETPEGRKIEAALQANLGPALRVDRLPLGWSRCRIARESGALEVLALPPSFPGALGRRLLKSEEGWNADEVVDWTAYLPLTAHREEGAKK